MKKIVLLFTLLACFASVSLQSCDEDKDTCRATVNAGITEVSGPFTTTVNVPVILIVKFNTQNGCSTGHRLVSTSSFPKIITAVVDYEGCTCTDISELITAQYEFSAAEPGQYELKFRTGDNTFITRLISVTQ